jgi:hypothetical protein
MSDLNRYESNARRNDPEGTLASILHQAETWTSVQGALLSQVETLWADWLHRRRDAIAATGGSLQAICDCYSLGELMRIQQRWFAGAIERSMADAEALVSVPLALSKATTRAPARTAEVTTRSVRQGSRAAPANVVEAPNQQVAAE